MGPAVFTLRNLLHPLSSRRSFIGKPEGMILVKKELVIPPSASRSIKRNVTAFLYPIQKTISFMG